MASKAPGAGTTLLALPPRDPATPAYRWLSEALRAAILEGRLRPGVRLPATRDLAGSYDLARGTVVAAFTQLRAEGYVAGRTGSGTYVSGVLPDQLLQVGRAAAVQPLPRVSTRRAGSRFARRVRPFPALSPGAPRAFRTDQPPWISFRRSSGPSSPRAACAA